ncbi:MAG: hypothetical protein GQ574_11505 [Crocinitomix sp.]|nr:hypothetical protein [Crocinitomix sp.]
MNDKELVFPVYRKYVGINVWFMILNEKNFIEIKQVGNRFVREEVVANQYPEMVLIKDMLVCHENRWEITTEAEFESANNKVII